AQLVPERPRPAGRAAPVHEQGNVDRLLVRVAAVHDPADLRGARGTLMESHATKIGLGVWTALVVAFLWIPLVIIALYAFNASPIQSWPITSWSTKWFGVAWHDDFLRSSLRLSIEVGLAATAIALVLGTMASFAIQRFAFFGRDSISFLLLLPIALPGIITGMALNSFFSFAGVAFSIWTIVIGHATF